MESNGERQPLIYIVRKANKKTVADITKEIRNVQHQTIDASTEVLGEILTRLEQWVIDAPLWIKKLGVRLMRDRGLLKKKHFGTIGITAIGMSGPIATLVIVGGIMKKSGVIDDQILIRDYLHITIAAEYSVVDGGPLVRFVSWLTELLGTGYGL